MIRLQKLLAEAGLGSRRTVEGWIREGRVTVGGRTAQLGDRASHTDEVRLDGRKLDLGAEPDTDGELLLYYKRVGEITTRRDPQGRPTVFERLPRPGRGHPGPDIIRSLLAGVSLEDGPARFDRISADPPGEGAHSSFRVVLHEGRNREVRRLWQAVGFDVSRLLRIRYGPIELPRGMRPGEARMADAALLAR